MIHNLIVQRKSTVLFDNMRDIPQEDINQLFEAARWAPSSNNQQPWRFVYAARTDSGYRSLLSCLSTDNQEWASQASMLVLSIAEVISDYKNRRNKYAWHDTGMAYTNLVFQALSLGLSIHPMGGFDPVLAREVAQIPERFEPVIFAAVGYHKKEGDFPKALLEREMKKRIRKPLEDIAFKNHFGG